MIAIFCSIVMYIWLVIQYSVSDCIRQFYSSRRVTHACVNKLGHHCFGLTPVQWQTVIWPNACVSSIETLRTKIGEIWIEIDEFSFKKMPSKMLCSKCQALCLGFNTYKKLIVVHISYGRSCVLHVIYVLPHIWLIKLFHRSIIWVCMHPNDTKTLECGTTAEWLPFFIDVNQL